MVQVDDADSYKNALVFPLTLYKYISDVLKQYDLCRDLTKGQNIVSYIIFMVQFVNEHYSHSNNTSREINDKYSLKFQIFPW